ncbi:MAG: hypothetical protein DBX63_01200 [Clostridia bacterium]|nr:MAG: hypothetical protein DBX63_01200 [Clostridia bacterium]
MLLMTKRSNRLLALASVVLLAAPLAACTSGSAGNSDLIDIEMPISTATPAPTGSLSGGPASPSPSADASPSVPPDASAAPESSATPRPTSSIDASTITGNENIEDEKKLTYAEYRALNSDVVGWIKIKDTNVDYPIVQSHDNEEYLTLTPTLVESKAGSLFVDSHASLSGQYAVIHGHNMSKSKIMFAQLTNYGNRAFYDSHRTFELTIGDNTYTYKVFAVYTVDVGDVKNAKYMMFDYPSDIAFANYMNDTLATLSKFPVDTTIGPDDHVISLSTCSHNGSGYNKNRFVVHAVRQ